MIRDYDPAMLEFVQQYQDRVRRISLIEQVLRKLRRDAERTSQEGTQQAPIKRQGRWSGKIMLDLAK